MDKDTHPSLIVRISDSQDSVAWDQFVQIYQPMLTKLAKRWGLQAADADELVQDVMLAVSKSVHRFTPNPKGRGFRAWLTRIAKNKLVDQLSVPARQIRGSGDTDVLRWLSQQPDHRGEGSVWHLEQKRELFIWAAKQTKNSVTEKTWLAFHRTAIDGELVSKVARDLEIREALVYVAKSRVMARIRKLVQEWLIQDQLQVPIEPHWGDE